MAAFNGLAALFGTELADSFVFDAQPSTIPAGFDSIVQISTPLMHRTLAANLAQWNLNPLSARVPYQPDLVSPGLRALIQPLLRPIDAVIYEPQPYLEVQALNPTPQALNWPTPPDLPVATGATSVAARSAITQPKIVNLDWTFEVNLFWPRITPEPVTSVGSVGTAPAGPSNGPTTGPGRGSAAGGIAAPPFGGIAVLPVNGGQIIVLPPPLPDGSRTSLGRGTAAMGVPSSLAMNAQLYQFRLVVNFEGAQPTYTSSDPVMLEFLGTDLASSLLAQAIAPLLNQYAVGLSPTMALAGSLTPSQVTQAQLPALHVTDMVLQDAKGQLVAFCVSLGNDSHGAFSMVTSFLSGQDFAYYVSDKVYTPVLKGLWRANAILSPIVSDVAVEMPVSQDSDQTGTGRARVQVKLGVTLDDAALIASTASTLGDPMRIVSQQTVTLLALWDPQGNPVTDLGDLAKPALEPLALSLQLFDRPTGTQHALSPALSNLLTAMFMPLFFPMIERYAVTAVTGFTSSPLRSLVARWSLPRIGVAVNNPIGGTLAVS